MNVGLLIVRIVVGGLFVGHGTQKLFGWWGGNGLKGTGGWLDSLGYRPGTTMAALAGVAEAGDGLLLVLGLITPLGAAAVIGVMVNAMLAVHVQHGMWNSDGGAEFPLTMATVAAMLGFTGPGRFSLDRAMGLDLSGIVWGLLTVLVGIMGGIALFAYRSSVTRRSTAQRRAAERPAA